MAKAIYFDMDGTIAELYEVQDWLPKLRAEDASPYAEAEPKVDLRELAKTLKELKKKGYTVGVITWLSMDSSREYKKAVREAKAQWLKKIPFKFDEIHMVQHGTPKHRVAKHRKGILVDDNRGVCEKWEQYGGKTIDANPKDWVLELQKI